MRCFASRLGSDWEPVARAVAGGRLADVPVMVDFGRSTPPLALEDLLLKHLRPGDIFTHTYAHVPLRPTIRAPVLASVHPLLQQYRRGELETQCDLVAASR